MDTIFDIIVQISYIGYLYSGISTLTVVFRNSSISKKLLKK